jgi:hypothetical protein
MVEKKKLLSLFVSLWWALLLRKINTFFFFFAHVFFYFCRRRHFELHAHEEKKFRFHSLSLFPLSARALLLLFVSVERSNAFVSVAAHRKGVFFFFFFLSFSPCGAKQRDCESPEEEKKTISLLFCVSGNSWF